ncbi:MAG: hypothetical protein DYG94_04470 [Leptolyngbya sp. PLA3]|nr:MAG: hypothetical protein EDM82_07425 [Cyanobacteria bacterium CYA]MCE7967986.1 hypothetical protein [Leptolyngbya sp. PL-A3]
MRRPFAALLIALCGLSAPTPAQDVPLSPAVEQRLGATFLADEERKNLRVFHGLWEDADLDTPARRAAAALTLGAIDHPWLHDVQAPVLDRAEAMLLRGELGETLTLLEGEGAIRGIRLRADALAGLGRFDESDAALDSLVEMMFTQKLDALELVEGVRGLLLRMQIRGPARGDGTDYRQVLSLINKARDEMDRLAWPVRLAEAELLHSRHNAGEAAAAAIETLSLNPRCQRAWALLGELKVAGFDFDGAEQIAEHMDELAGLLDAVSPDAQIIRIRSLLRQREPDEADEPLERLLGAYPMHREGLALGAAVAAGRYDDSRTSALLAQFDQLSPAHPLALYQVGRVQSETRQYQAAAASLEAAHRRLPNWSAPLIELGLMEMQSGRDDRALDALQRAMALDPFNARAANSMRLIEQLANFARFESAHFIIKCRPGVDEVLAREMPAVLERIHARVCGDQPGGIDHEPAHKTVLELMPTHETFAVRITGMPNIHTMAASTGPVIAMESPREGAGSQAGSYDWARVVQHEYTHTVTLSRTNNRIAHWMTEAAAVYLEDSPRDADTWKLLAHAFKTDALFDMDEINFAFVRPEKPTDRAQAYAQGHWMYEFIIERFGPRAPLDLMDRAAEGVLPDQAFQASLGLDHARFLEAFKPWAEDQLRARGLLLPDGVPDLTELIEPWTNSWAQAGTAPDAAARIEALRAIQRDHPDHPEVLEALILALSEQGSGEPTEEMLPLLARYAEVCPVDDLPHRLLARWYLTRDDRAAQFQAIPHLEFLDARDTTGAEFAAQLADLYLRSGDYERASLKAERATAVAPFDAGLREQAARAALLGKDYDTAERHIQALTNLEPDREQHRKRLEAVRVLRSGG